MPTPDAATRAAINAAANRAARAAVKETFLTLGVDVTTPHEVREFQLDLIHARQSRLAVKGRGRYWLVIFSTSMTVLGAVLTMTIQHFFGGKP